MIIDIHEGWGFNKINNKSMGSTITTYNFPKLLENNIIQNINMTIADQNKKFSVNTENMNKYSGTLHGFIKNKNKKYILIELTGQNNIQPIELRIAQGINILNSIFDYCKIF